MKIKFWTLVKQIAAQTGAHRSTVYKRLRRDARVRVTGGHWHKMATFDPQKLGVNTTQLLAASDVAAGRSKCDCGKLSVTRRKQCQRCLDFEHRGFHAGGIPFHAGRPGMQEYALHVELA